MHRYRRFNGLQQLGVCEDGNEGLCGKLVIYPMSDLWQCHTECQVHYEEAHGAFFPLV